VSHDASDKKSHRGSVGEPDKNEPRIHDFPDQHRDSRVGLIASKRHVTTAVNTAPTSSPPAQGTILRPSPRLGHVQSGRIRHTVSFRLRHAAGSDAERDFLDAADGLSEIPGVEAFDILAEVSPKNGFRFGISMEFGDPAAYEAYNEHPEHVRFVEERWANEVEEFLEIDFAALSRQRSDASGS
jgi:hypothetical protein